MDLKKLKLNDKSAEQTKYEGIDVSKSGAEKGCFFQEGRCKDTNKLLKTKYG